MKVLLIRPPYDLKAISPNFPIGLAYLASSLRHNGHSPEILDLPLESQPFEALVERLRGDTYPLVGISALTVQYPGARKVVELIRSASPRSRIVLGGPHPSVLPERTLEETKADFAIIGEGERAIVALADALEGERTLEDVPSLARRGHDGVKINPAALPLDPNNIPLPAYDLLDLGPYFDLQFSEYVRAGSRPMQIFTSRGCPYHCTFCHELFGKKFRARSPESVFEEILLLHHKFGVNEFLIYDDIFNLDLRRAKDIFRLVLKSGLRVGFSFPNGMRAERMDEELMATMAEAGVHTVTVAVESASQRMQKVIRKHLKLDSVTNFLRLAKSYEVRTQAFFIIGFPEETLAEIHQTIRFARSLRDLDYAFFSFATPYPGTELARRASNRGIPVALTMDALDFYLPHVETEEFSFRKLKWLRLKASLWFYATPRRLWNLARQLSSPQFRTLYIASLGRMMNLLNWSWRGRQNRWRYHGSPISQRNSGLRITS
jgi:anaerobic magnesium-protoporphyrin IX monomethyl ester cyclase